MFSLKTEQKVCCLGGLKLGGRPGENPPLLISSMFHNGDRILESRKDARFDRAKAEEYLRRQEELSAQTGIPSVTAIVANTAGEMKEYVDWFTGVSDGPFAIDMWVEKARLEAAEYIAAKGLQERLLYNSITPWDKDIAGQAGRLKEMGIKHVVVQAFDVEDPSPKGRLTSFRRIMDTVGADTFETVLVDTSVMNLPAIAISGAANRLIKEETGWPAGMASSNGTYMWKEARELFGSEGFTAMNAAGQGAAALLFSDFIFYGPIVAAPRIFPAVVTGTVMLATAAYAETGLLPSDREHPLYRFFGDFADKLKESLGQQSNA